MARDFSDMEKQYSAIPLGSTSPILSPFVTVDPERISPLMAPFTFVKTFLPDTEPIGCPLMIRFPIFESDKKIPAHGALRTRSCVWPAISPGTPVSGEADPE